ncbi:DUF3613 domain-containing protein [Cupriavidus oxalaticus]|uniref:DUF3613 domain-containing protein n=1 Tax=Cupriavidus oxalaticus TaxID=96344 RepID=A0A375GI81_9BURK|nr:DUF3613 domain-containing protein [Cupriavidus oxalaticus]QRQ84382.1 DUF3613 domain-containing protein [Cupriavidus oxalaticus]QRQ91531.1 DUF3613 domain-containing protein [Cupriavidus oxalaticus]WQD86101.1 DUF3613 domain-containing protein [Cupriavidus oxalaticus]SPC19607.1 conserved exported hypothetical protein [Cupriavidus oxalaticus]
MTDMIRIAFPTPAMPALCAALCVLLAPAAQAQPAAPSAEASAGTIGTPAERPAMREIGADTRAILAVQREGMQAGPLLPMHGEQAALGYERYMNSFRFALPEFYTGQANASTARAGSAGQMLNGK